MSANGSAVETARRYRHHGLRPHRGNKMLLAAAGECARPVDVHRKTMTEFALEAAYRKMLVEDLVGKVLDNVAADDLFAAVVDID